MDWILRCIYRRGGCLVFADYVLFAMTLSSFMSLEWFAARIKVSPSEFEAVVFNWKKMNPSLWIGDESLPQEFNNLRILFVSDNKLEREVKMELSRKAKLWIYQFIFVLTLTYGHEIWVVTNE